jgi:hypothetical protein
VKALLIIQITYYYLTALWPLIHIRSFILVSGPKDDLWLVKTVSVLLLAVCNTLLAVLLLNNCNIYAGVLAMNVCCGFIIIEIHYVRKGTISPVYLLDAVVQLALLISWIIIVF